MTDFNMSEDEQEKALAAINGWLAKRQGVYGWHQSEDDLWIDVFRAVNPLCPVFPISFLKTHIRRVGYALEHEAKRGYRLDLSDPALMELAEA